MQGPSRRALSVIVLFAAINVAGLAWIHRDLTSAPRATVRVLSASLSPGADDPDRIRLVFDRDMIAEASVGRIENAGIFELTPVQPGQWIWAARDRLEYVFDKPFSSGRVLRLRATQQVREVTGRTVEGTGEFMLIACPLRLVSSEVVASDGRDITMQVTFNQPVDPGEFLRHASLCDGKTLAELAEPQCLTNGPQKALVLRFPRPESNCFTMALDASLTGYEGDAGLGGSVSVTREVAPGFALLHTYIEPPDLGESASVRLYFSQELSDQQQVPQLQVQPAAEDLRVHISDNALIASGKFMAGRQYTIRVPGTLMSEEGKTLGEDVSLRAEFPDYTPAIAFEHSEGILSPLGTLAVDARGVNLEQVAVQVWRVHANNLVPHLHRADVDQTSQSVVEKTIPVKLPHNQPKKMVLGLQDLLPASLGIYRVEAWSADHRWTRDGTIITVTDLAITAKRHRDGYLVWVTSLRTAKPVPGVVVNGLTYNNQRVATVRTDANGIAELQFAGRRQDGDIWVITAAKDGDLSYLQPGDNQWAIDNVDQHGRPYADHYETMLYTDRGVYRPGETIHLTGIIRDTTGAIASRFPLSIKICRPDGRQVSDLTVSRREKDQGVFHMDFTPSAEAQIGVYRFSVTLPGSEDVLGSTSALVEAFVPVRMEVTATPSSERFGPNTPPVVKIAGRYLWDQPAADLPVKIEGTLWPAAFESKAHPDFQFGSNRRQPPIQIPAAEGQLNGQGLCEVQVKLPENLKAGLYAMRLSATVTEPGGRSVSSNTSATLDLLDAHIGLRLAKGQVVPAGEAIPVNWVLRTGQDQPATSGRVTAQLMRVEYDTALKKVDGRYVWQSVEKIQEVGEERKIAPAESQGSFEIMCPDVGMYRMAATDVRSGSITCLEFYASRDTDGAQSLAMNQPERVEIVTDKKRYLPGENAKVLLRSPIPGAVLLTVETDSVIAHHSAEIAEHTCEIEVPLPTDLRGSVFLTATVLRAVDPNQESWLPHRGLGTVQVLMDHTSRRIPVSIDAPAKARPGEAVTVTVDVGRPIDPNQPAVVHIWGVDEGILLTSAYETPDLHEFFLGPRLASVSTADVFGWLLPDYKRPAGMTRIGGDGFDVDALRRSPVATRTRKPAVIWREAVVADSEGRLTLQMQLPDLTGQLRIMAVAVDHDRYGTGEHALIVTSPLLVESSWPRSVAPGDRFTVPVKLFNSTDRPVTVRIKTTVSGPIELSSSEDAQSPTVEPGKPVTRLLQGVATGMGPAEVKIEAVEEGAADTPLEAHCLAALPARPATALHTAVELKTVPAGQEVRLQPPDLFLKGTTETTVSVSARPSVELEPAMEELIGYPYGCVEQTSSRLLSLLYASRILDPNRAKAIDGMVNAGIARLWSMQTPSGGLSYWPGQPSASLWGTAYAASCLREAENAGYQVDSRFTGELVKYLESRLRTADYDVADLNTKALICNVLAAFDRPPHGWMARLAEQKEKLDLAALAHLAGAFHAAGNKEKALSLLPADPPAATVATTTTGRLTSQVQQEAVWLSSLLEIDPNHPMVAPLAASLNKARSCGQWGSTLNNAAAIAALARYQAATARDQPEFTGAIEAEDGRIARFNHKEPASLELPDSPGVVRISSEGHGTLYVVTMTKGLVRDDLVKPYERQLHVERRWTDRQGRPVDANGLTVGDLVQVEIIVSTPAGTVENIAIVDALAGGMEVENPRLATSAETGEPHGDSPDHIEFLDDRVVLFCAADSHTRTFRYALRVITAGEFVVPPIQASCMYDPAIACLGQPGRVVIRDR